MKSLKRKVRKPRALGSICGIGSMLIGAKQAGFYIIGNIEWRRYYYTGTFEHNFPGAFMIKTLDELKEVPSDIDLIMGHTECGNFSNLSYATTVFKSGKNKDAADIPQFVLDVQKIKPRFFIMDNLPRSLEAFTVRDWIEKLLGYDIYFEWISNFNYGNLQKFRNRLFVIGAKEGEGFVFVPGEFFNDVTVRDTIEDLYESGEDHSINHAYKPLSEKSQISNVIPGRAMTIREARDMFLKLGPSKCPTYRATDGSIKSKIGKRMVWWDRYAFVLDGGECHFHSITGLPLTCRERARIQGCPDDFIFILPKGKQFGSEMIKQTGKFMPVQFCNYISRQIIAHIKNEKFETTGKRLLKPNKIIDKAKKEYCEKKGYSNQEGACYRCWIEDCKKRRLI